MKNAYELLIIGTGIYVCGRGTKGYGTVMPAVLQMYKEGYLNRVIIASSHKESFTEFDVKLTKMKSLIEVDFDYEPYYDDNSNSPAFLRALEAMSDQGAVIIVTPDHMHYEMARTALKLNKHTLVVKPLVHTVNECYDLINTAKEKELYGVVEFHKRWDWANQKIKILLENGEIGKPIHFLVEYSQRKSIPAQAFSKWVNKTNIFQYLGVHYVDLIYYLTNDTPKRLCAIGQYGWLKEQGINNYDSIQVLIEWSSGFSSTFITSWVDPEKTSAISNQSIKINGTKGIIDSNQKTRGLQLINDEAGIDEINPYFTQVYPSYAKGLEFRGYGIESISCFLRDVECIISCKNKASDFDTIRPTFNEALVSCAVVEGVNYSLNLGGKWIRFDEQLNPY